VLDFHHRRLSLALALTSVVLLVGCGSEKAASAVAKGPRRDVAIPVTVAKATMRDVPIQAEVIGAAEASSAVTLKPQISGQLLKAYFNEGDFVKAGQLLLDIDPRALEAQRNQLQAQVMRDEAALAQAQAALARDRAQEANAQSQLKRAEELSREGIISKEQYDTAATLAATYGATTNADLAAIENSKAQIAASRAAVENIKVQLGYTKIYAPISGRTGTLMVKPGNIVTANTTELATINQVQPIFVTFALPEGNLGALRGGGKNMTVTATPEEGGALEAGSVSFFENAVDTSTGTIKLKASFPNSNRALWPGQFVRVTLKLGERSGAILVPTQAVQSGQDGTFVYIVKSDQKVDVRPVVAAQRLGDESVLTKGLDAGETVVTEGALRLIPGAKVQVRERPNGPRGAGKGGGKGPGGPPEAGAAPAATEGAATPGATEAPRKRRP
jgi:multidrug efflux system membrane fusion protein